DLDSRRMRLSSDSERNNCSGKYLRFARIAYEILEFYYDFKFLPNLRLGFSVQGRDDFNETVLGVRVKSDFDVTPRGRLLR
ncbi:MAG: hypothetical protein MJK14_28060, partial [Rivularia sp. ALOHA_DT_140]|nr:hypothetical protein [Rivularia sp. ALOHA_DT_140]